MLHHLRCFTFLLSFAVCLNLLITPSHGIILQSTIAERNDSRPTATLHNSTLISKSLGSKSIALSTASTHASVGLDFNHTATVESNSTTNPATRTAPKNGSFPFIIPYGTSQSCDIFGPICQPGSITVNAVNRDKQTSLVTLPCSSYLASQSSYLDSNKQRTEIFGDYVHDFIWPQQWGPKFGRGSKCTSYMDMLSKSSKSSQWTFSDCQAGGGVGSVKTKSGIADFPPQVPPGFVWYDEGGPMCCGNSCNLDIPDYRLWYFKDENAEEYCHSRGRKITGLNSTAFTEQDHKRILKRLISTKPDIAGRKTAVVRGHTLTSPSLYLEVLGTVSAWDACGDIGKPATNPIIAVPPGGLKTLTTTNWKLGDDSGGSRSVSAAPLTVADLECPTFGYGSHWAASSTLGHVPLTVGPPWLPIIETPEEIYDLDPELKDRRLQCTHNWPSYDPPQALNPGDEIDFEPVTPNRPEVTPNNHAKNSPNRRPVQPGSTPSPDQPAPTQNPAKKVPEEPAPESHNLRPQQDLLDPANPGKVVNTKKLPQGGANNQRSSLPQKEVKEVHTALPSKQNGRTSEHATNAPGQNPPTVEEVPGRSGSQRNQGHHPPANPIIVGTHTFHPAPTGFEVASKTVKPGLPAVTIAGTPVSLGTSNNLVVGTKTIDLDPIQPFAPNPAEQRLPVFTVGGHSFTANPSGFVMADTSVAPDGPAAVISGTRVSLESSGRLVLGSQTMFLGSSTNPAATPLVLNIAGHSVTPNPSGFVVAGSTISPGARPITISGTRISLGTSDGLVVESQTISLPPAQEPLPPKVTTIAGQSVALNPKGFVIAGITLSPGGSPLYISGTRVSLGPSGNLAIGSSTLSIPTMQVTDSISSADGKSPASQTRNKVITFAGHTITPSPSGFGIDGSIILPGGSGIVLDGSTLGLGTNGVLSVNGQASATFNGAPTRMTPGGGSGPNSPNYSTDGVSFTGGSSKRMPRSVLVIWYTAICLPLLIWGF